MQQGQFSIRVPGKLIRELSAKRELNLFVNLLRVKAAFVSSFVKNDLSECSKLTGLSESRLRHVLSFGKKFGVRREKAGWKIPSASSFSPGMGIKVVINCRESSGSIVSKIRMALLRNRLRRMEFMYRKENDDSKPMRAQLSVARVAKWLGMSVSSGSRWVKRLLDAGVLWAKKETYEIAKVRDLKALRRTVFWTPDGQLLVRKANSYSVCLDGTAAPFPPT